jgi:hypothetical protein
MSKKLAFLLSLCPIGLAALANRSELWYAEPSQIQNKKWLPARKRRVFGGYIWVTKLFRMVGWIKPYSSTKKNKKKFFLKAEEKKSQIFKLCFFDFFFVENRLPHLLSPLTKFKPNPSSHLGGDREVSPDRQTDRQTDSI